MIARTIIYYQQPEDVYRLGRTLRSLQLLGITAEIVGSHFQRHWPELLRAGRPLLLLRSGVWLYRPELFNLPSPSSTGTGLCAFGLAHEIESQGRGDFSGLSEFWRQLLARTGGELSRLTEFPRPAGQTIPAPAALYLEAAALNALEFSHDSPSAIIAAALKNLRVVHHSPMDVMYDSGLRILQVITALHRGGAERLTLQLLASLPAFNVRARLACWGRALRQSFQHPAGTLDLSRLGNREAKTAALARAGSDFGADLIHAHLLRADDLRSISNTGFPLLTTVHNTRSGWPEGLDSLQPAEIGLLAACSQAVESELRAASPIAIRTVWNGINLKSCVSTPERQATARRWRLAWGFGLDDCVIVSIANPRPQKRLHLLPPILAELRKLLAPQRPARLLLCGEPIPGNPETEACVAQLKASISRLGLDAHVRWLGSISEIGEILAAADVLVSTSAHEGLSLAQLEALAAGRPVVATRVGGTPEIAKTNPHCHLVPSDATPQLFARVILGALGSALASAPVMLSPDWTREQMAARYAWLYPRVIASKSDRNKRTGLWLITNNFSTGGAQSSARRLLEGLSQKNIKVRATVVEEAPDHPTPGRKALLSAGIPVHAIPILQDSSATTCAQILALMDDDSPESVIFWNLRPSLKLLLADALVHTPVFDVSPGEMYFDSLEKYFAKPLPGFPYRSTRDYGANLRGVIVKYHGEAAHAAKTLGTTVHVIPNGVNLSELSTTEARERPSRVPRVVFGTAARIHPQKRLEDLLAAFHFAHHSLPVYTLRIAGGVETGCDDYHASLRDMARDLSVEWLGEVTDLPSFHRTLDVFVMISEPAGCPNASLEAMASGLPVIATDVGGASEQIINNETGILLPPRDKNSLATALIELASQPELRTRLGLNARKHVEEAFALERMISEYKRVLGLAG